MINFIHIPKNAGTSIKYICGQNKGLQYNGHNYKKFNKKLENQLIILRDPIERFISAMKYSLQKWSKEPHVKYLIDRNITTPEKWVQIWMDPKHKEYHHLMKMIKNTQTQKHRIGNEILNYKQTYEPQSLWVDNPKYVIIMDNYDEELKYFMDKHNFKYKNIKKNNTRPIENDLSESSKKFLMAFYKDDYEEYKKYKEINYKDRLPLYQS